MKPFENEGKSQLRDRSVGGRIRERRLASKKRQADLASAVGISASYLNLIEHDKRRIGGKLLVDIASVLEVEPSLLSEGAEAALIADLREAAVGVEGAEPELDRVDEFAGRYPGWAQVIRSQHRAGLRLEQTVGALSDRLAHDPELAASMHEVLSMVTAVHATAGILHENRELEPEWRARFHRNLNEDSQRLAESSQQLVNYLDGSKDAEARRASPRDELQSFLREAEFHFDRLERGGKVEDLLRKSDVDFSPGALKMVTEFLNTYASNAKNMPLGKLQDRYAEYDGDLNLIAQSLEASLPQLMHRLAFLPPGTLPAEFGIVVCDMAGTLLLRKELKGFTLPRYSSACPKWPMFRALFRPGQPLFEVVEFAARDNEQFKCYAISEAMGSAQFGQETNYNAVMLFTADTERLAPKMRVGASCRICPNRDCASRREPSILVDGI